jgi:hypothetical protein
MSSLAVPEFNKSTAFLCVSLNKGYNKVINPQPIGVSVNRKDSTAYLKERMA